MGILLDTSIFIAAERGRFDFPAFLRTVPAGDDVAMSAVTAAELIIGVERASAAHRAKREPFVEALVARFMVVPFDLSAARVHARVAAELAARGQPVGAHDLLMQLPRCT